MLQVAEDMKVGGDINLEWGKYTQFLKINN